jgi:hypothetical protein
MMYEGVKCPICNGQGWKYQDIWGPLANAYAIPPNSKTVKAVQCHNCDATGRLKIEPILERKEQ